MKLIAGIVLLGFLLVSVSATRIERNTDDEIIRGNKYIDDSIQKFLDEEGRSLDPYDVDDHSIGFSKKVVFVEVSGEAKLHQCYITGLSSLHRSDDCSLREENGKLILTAKLAAGVIKLNCEGTVTFMNYGPAIKVMATMGYVEVHLEAKIDSETGRDGELIKLKIMDMRGLDIEVSGLGPLDWALNFILNGISTFFQTILRYLFETKVYHYLSEIIRDILFPLAE